jgi:hypothetical protein
MTIKTSPKVQERWLYCIYCRTKTWFYEYVSYKGQFWYCKDCGHLYEE